MDYKEAMGFGKKKPIKKKNRVIESIKQEFGYVNEALTLKDVGDGIFDMLHDFHKMVKKHPTAKKNRKVNAILKQMYKLELQLSNELSEIE